MQRPDCDLTRSRRQAAFPIVSLLAERLTRTFAPATAALLLGGIGVHKSSQISTAMTASPHENTFVIGCSNGYIYYAATAEQLRNPGAAQEDCDTLVAPEWQPIFEEKAADILRRLQ